MDRQEREKAAQGAKAAREVLLYLNPKPKTPNLKS